MTELIKEKFNEIKKMKQDIEYFKEIFAEYIPLDKMDEANKALVNLRTEGGNQIGIDLLKKKE